MSLLLHGHDLVSVRVELGDSMLTKLERLDEAFPVGAVGAKPASKPAVAGNAESLDSSFSVGTARSRAWCLVAAPDHFVSPFISVLAKSIAALIPFRFRIELTRDLFFFVSVRTLPMYFP